jgi:RNA polymerase sigma-70 factor (ECF subfamily)
MKAEKMTDRTDEHLVAEARDGDNDAFKELVRRHESRVAATVIGMLGNCPEADDVGQETFIRFYRALGSFRGDSSVGTYLTRIAINLSLNELKRRKRLFSVFSRPKDEEVPDLPDPKSSGLSYEDKKVINWALQKLKPEFRAVLVLRLIDGYSTEETAAIMKVPLGTVLSRLARAQKKMKEILTPYFGDER